VRCIDAIASLHSRLRSLWARRSGIAPSMAVAGLVLCAAGTADVTPMHVVNLAPAFDSRAVRLERFFRRYHCRTPHHVLDYLRAADAYALDYRLLPAISIRESLCGIADEDNNWWGYHPGRQTFSSIAAGIDYVAQQLARSPFYRGKTLQQKLFTYNPLPAYPDEIQKIMRQIE
jgi:hypothetical protein